MDKFDLDTTIFALAESKTDIIEWIEQFRKRCKITRSQFSDEIIELIQRLKLCIKRRNAELTVQESIIIEDSPLKYLRSDKLDFCLSELEDYLDFLLKKPIQNHIETILTSEYNKGSIKPKYTFNQIALKYVYEKEVITLNNCNEIAINYGYTAGRKLFQRYSFYRSDADRKGRPDTLTRRTMRNKIKLFESVIDMLNVDNRQRIVSEIVILKGYLENEFL